MSRRVLGLIVSQGIAEAAVEVLERKGGVRLPRQHQQWVGVLLGAALGAFARIFRDEHDCTHEFVLALFVRLEWWREKRAIGIAVLVSQTGRWGSNVRGDSLRSDANPVAAGISKAAARKLQRPEGCVNAHFDA